MQPRLRLSSRSSIFFLGLVGSPPRSVASLGSITSLSGHPRAPPRDGILKALGATDRDGAVTFLCRAVAMPSRRASVCSELADRSGRVLGHNQIPSPPERPGVKSPMFPWCLRSGAIAIRDCRQPRPPDYTPLLAPPALNPVETLPTRTSTTNKKTK